MINILQTGCQDNTKKDPFKKKKKKKDPFLDVANVKALRQERS